LLGPTTQQQHTQKRHDYNKRRKHHKKKLLRHRDWLGFVALLPNFTTVAMQIFVQFRGTSVCEFDDTKVVNGCDIREAVSSLENIPHDCFFMQMDGKVICDDDIINDNNSMNIRVSLRVLGGKGGFGAMLKSKYSATLNIICHIH
jgi:hypothetical protein